MQMGWTRRAFLAASAAAIAQAALPFGARAAQPASAAGARQRIVESFVRDNGFHGVVRLVHDGRVAFSRAFGMADIEAGRAAAVDTLYPLASISKWLTTLSVLRLVDRGQLDLAGRISDYLSGYRADTGARVTLAHLLSNMSGIPNRFDPKADPGVWTRPYTTQEAIAAFCSGDLAFDPGTRFDYQFTNWVIVQGIVETVTGRLFADAVDSLTLTPLGLPGIVPRYTDDARERVAIGYASTEPLVRKMFPQRVYGLASGGYCGRAQDLIRAAHGAYADGFLSDASRAALSAVRSAADGYALGGRVRTVKIGARSMPFAWETGNTEGYRSLLGHRLDGRTSLVVLNNTSLSQKTIDLFADALLSTL